MKVSLSFLECDPCTPPRWIDNMFLVFYEHGLIHVYCRQCGKILYSQNLKELRNEKA